MTEHHSSPSSRSGRRISFAWMVCAALLLSACASGTVTGGTATVPGTGTLPAAVGGGPVPTPVQHLDITGVEYSFKISPEPSVGLRPGWTRISFHNAGGEAHQVMFARLKDGVDLAELGRVAGTDSSGAAAINFVDMLGGVSYIGPGQSTEAVVNLPPGIVMAMCYVPNHDGTAHALLGMSTMLTVTADPAGTPSGSGPPTTASLPPATATPSTPGDVKGTIELAADGYRIPSPLPAGWYRVINTDAGTPGKGLHELSILRLGRHASPAEADALIHDLARNAAPNIPLEALGGMGAISPGFDGYLYLDLHPGEYVAVDFMPDPNDARPHLLNGYYKTFSV
jgi:hypothetical protein